MNRALVLVAVLAACKSKEPPQPQPTATATAPAVAAAADAGSAADWIARCEAALAGARQVEPVHRAQAIIDGCRPCGDWTPLLRWNVLAADGGPRTEAIADAMDGCRAYCKPEARNAFLRTLEAARGKHTSRPWRELGAACGPEVSAKPDDRYLSAPFFALDRIARAAAASDRLAPLLAEIELPLPPVSATGGAFVLPAAQSIAPDAGAVHVTVSTTEITVGALPRARLSGTGVTVHAGEALYPGASVTPKTLAAALDKLSPDPTARIALIAPKGMAARRLLDVVAAAGTHPLVLAADAAGAPEGWHLPGVVPIPLTLQEAPGALRISLGASPDAALQELEAAPADQLTAPPVIALDDKATVEGLARLLGGLARRGVPVASLRRARS